MRLLIVEDDKLLVQALSTHLAAQRYVVDVAMDGEDGWSFAQATTYDLILLDVNLPKLNGLHLCQRLRQTGYRQPILLLTAQGDSLDKITGLDAGADDYVVKPCPVEELCARIRALLRRQPVFTTSVLEWAALRLDSCSREVTYQDQLVSLTSKEYSLLELFLRHPKQVFSGSNILECLWGFEEPSGGETVRTLIKRLRRKLKAAGAEDVIETLYGQGYRLVVLPKQPIAVKDGPRQVALAAWEQFKEPMLEQLAVVDQAIAAIQTGCLSPGLHDQAAEAAHKLTGSLGMFGFPEGSRLGREIEHWLQTGTGITELAHLKDLATSLHQELQAPPQPLHSSDYPDKAENRSRSWSQALSLLVIGADEQFMIQLQVEGNQCGIHVDGVPQIANAKPVIAHHIPDAVLVDLSSPNSSQERLALLNELTVQFPMLPVLVLLGSDALEDRLEIIRQSKCQFVSKTTSTREILAIVRDVLESSRLAETRVLAVDDDPLTLEVLQRLLSHQGVRLFTLDDPNQFWKTLNATAPDLLILDIAMPHIGGIELCQVVRSDRTWDNLPILFLTAHQDGAMVQKLFSVGADDYLTKPFTESQLLTHLSHRLRRRSFLFN